MQRASAKITGWLCLALLACATGCHHDTDFRKFDTISISLDDSLRDARNNLPAVEVNLIAITSGDLQDWKKKSVSQHFHSPRQDPSIVVMSLGEGQRSQSLSLVDHDPGRKKEAERIWAAWEKAKYAYLVVICDFPPPLPGTAPEDDPRRKILPLMYGWWDPAEKEIKIVVKQGGLSVLTAMTEPAK